MSSVVQIILIVLFSGVIAVDRLSTLRKACSVSSNGTSMCHLRHKRFKRDSQSTFAAKNKMMRSGQLLYQADAQRATSNLTSRDVLGCWGKDNHTRVLTGGSPDLEDTRSMLGSFAQAIEDTRIHQLLSHDESLAMKIPRCPRYDTAALIQNPVLDHLLGDDAASVKAYLDTALAGLDKAEPLILAIMEHFELPDTIHAQMAASNKSLANLEFASRVGRSELFLNFNCGMRRLGLDKRLVIFALDSTTNASLASFAGSPRVLHHPGLARTASRASQSTGIIYDNRMAKLVLPLLLLKRGFQVILTDIDSYWVRDPTPYLLTLGVDLAAQNDVCHNTLNSGFVYYSGSEKSHQVLELALSAKRFGNATHVMASDTDQYLFNCAHGHLFVHNGLHSTILPRPSFQFAVQNEGFVNFKCASQASSQEKTGDDQLPYLWHTAGTSCQTCVIDMAQTLKTVGFWDVKPTSAAAPGTQGDYCLDGVRDSSEKGQLLAKQLGLDSCRTQWHPGCQCKADAFVKS